MIEALAAAAMIAACSWDRPGANPFMGDVVAAVDRYLDIPRDTRARLKHRMQRRTYDAVAAITRDEIVAADGRRFGLLRDMHFGGGKVCGEVTRARWSDDMIERGLVYCEDGHCIIVPTVCRNVSRVTELQRPPVRLAQEIPGGSERDFGGSPLDIAAVDPGSWLAGANDPDDLPRMARLDAPVVGQSFEASRWPGPAFDVALPLPAGDEVAPIPEPTVSAMLALGLAIVGIAVFRDRRRPRTLRYVPVRADASDFKGRA